MLIVTGVFRVDPSDIDAFVEGRKPSMTSSRAEKGCLEYVIAADPLEPGRVILSERWESRADLDAHVAGMASAPTPDPSAPPAVELLSREIWIYEIASAEQMA